MNSIRVCLSPLLFPQYNGIAESIAVVVDVLRATTSFNAAFDAGVKRIIPVSELSELRAMKEKGFLTAAERDGKKVDFADFGNSPSVFLESKLLGSDLAYSTTNGTRAMHLARDASGMITACFSNLGAAVSYLSESGKDVLILCSGWKNGFSLEDTLCAGALSASLLETGQYTAGDDACTAAAELWQIASEALQEFASHGEHYQRLLRLDYRKDLAYCFRLNTSLRVPVWDGSGFSCLE
jgi:2-phosphosulfolactate phosphatase